MGRTMRSRGVSSYMAKKRTKRHGNKLSRRISKRRVKRTTKRSNRHSNRRLNRKSFKRASKHMRNNRKSYRRGGGPGVVTDPQTRIEQIYTIYCSGATIGPHKMTDDSNVYYYKIDISRTKSLVPQRSVFKRWSQIKEFEKTMKEHFVCRVS